MRYYDFRHYHIRPMHTAREYMGKYPKFLLFFITIILSYLIFSSSASLPFRHTIVSLGYIGTFLVGIFFAYSYTAAPATALFLILAKEQNIFISGLIGGLGALVGDLVIFSFISISFKDEIRKLAHEKIVVYLNNGFPYKIKKYLIPIFAGFLIASPLPDELGIALLAISQHISIKIFALLSFALNTLGIFAIFYIGNLIM